MSKALARRPVNIIQRARQGALASMLAEVAENDIAIVMAASRAAELDSPAAGEALLQLPKDELQRLGWASREELRLAIDAKKPPKEAPFYLKMVHERTLMRYRGQDGERPGEGAVIVMPDEEPPESAADAGPALPPPEGDLETNR